MTGDELRTEMRNGFKKVDDEFVNVRTEMRDGFKKVDDEFVNVRTEMRDGFRKVDDQFRKIDDEFSRVRMEIRVEGETTRRRFDIVAENLRESIRTIAEATAHDSSRR